MEKDITDMLQNSDDAGEHANDATPQVSKEPKDARGAHQHNHRSVARDSLSLVVEAIEHLDNATATLRVRYNGARGDLALKDKKARYYVDREICFNIRPAAPPRDHQVDDDEEPSDPEYVTSGEVVDSDSESTKSFAAVLSTDLCRMRLQQICL